jgi:hypothetical protein
VGAVNAIQNIQNVAGTDPDEQGFQDLVADKIAGEYGQKNHDDKRQTLFFPQQQ